MYQAVSVLIQAVQIKNAVQADITVTMALAKPGLFLYPAAELSGEIIVADIGMPKILLERMDSKKFLLTENIACDLLPQRNGNCHKGEAGRVVITAGSPGFYRCGCVMLGSGC